MRASRGARYGRLAADDPEAAHEPSRLPSISCRRSRPIITVVFGLACLFTFVWLSMEPSISIPSASVYNGPAWRSFASTPITRLSEDTSTTSLLSQRLFSLNCAERWIAKGELCTGLHGQVGEATRQSVDIVWTWVNGSSPTLRAWREALRAGSVPPPIAESQHLDRRAPPRRAAGPTFGREANPTDNHFRSHNELIYSMRSTVGILSGELRRRVLLTTDLPDDDDGGGAKRQGQIPSWLAESEGVQVAHHWSTFRTVRPPDGPSVEAWLNHTLPTFNSLAIETQLGHLDTAETILYANDDSFIGSPTLSLADLATPLYGPIFRLQNDLLVDSGDHLRSGDNIDGEWPSLRRTNFLLDNRFGARSRPYTAHVSKTFLRPILREMESIWPEEFAQTAMMRFRGHTPGLHISYLAAHYMIERHREVLLWSFLLGRRFEREQLLRYLCEVQPSRAAAAFARERPSPIDCPTDEIRIAWPTRATLEDDAVVRMLEQAGLARAVTTSYDFTSADGYPFVQLEITERRQHAQPAQGGGGMGGAQRRPPAVEPQGWPDYRADSERASFACTFSIETCFPRDIVTADAAFRHVTFVRPECGDCLIVAVLQHSGKAGLDGFLPPATTTRVDAPKELPLPGGTAKTWRDADFRTTAQPDRALALRLLQRYSYTLGNSHSRFIPIRSTNLLRATLDQLRLARDSARPPAFIVLNDDIRGSRTDRVDELLAEWFERMWPRPAPWERTPISMANVSSAG